MSKIAAFAILLLAFSATFAQQATPQQTDDWLKACQAKALVGAGCPAQKPTTPQIQTTPLDPLGEFARRNQQAAANAAQPTMPKIILPLTSTSTGTAPQSTWGSIVQPDDDVAVEPIAPPTRPVPQSDIDQKCEPQQPPPGVGGIGYGMAREQCVLNYQHQQQRQRKLQQAAQNDIATVEGEVARHRAELDSRRALDAANQRAQGLIGAKQACSQADTRAQAVSCFADWYLGCLNFRETGEPGNGTRGGDVDIIYGAMCPLRSEIPYSRELLKACMARGVEPPAECPRP